MSHPSVCEARDRPGQRRLRATNRFTDYTVVLFPQPNNPQKNNSLPLKYHSENAMQIRYSASKIST